MARPPTCVLYPPGLCERCVRRDRLAFANRHVLNEGHGRSVNVGTFKVIIRTNGSLQVPGKRREWVSAEEKDAVNVRRTEKTQRNRPKEGVSDGENVNLKKQQLF